MQSNIVKIISTHGVLDINAEVGSLWRLKGAVRHDDLA